MTAAPFTTGDACGFQIVTDVFDATAGNCAAAMAAPQLRQKLSASDSLAEQSEQVDVCMGHHPNARVMARQLRKA
jgi:hypothetical protein